MGVSMSTVSLLSLIRTSPHRRRIGHDGMWRRMMLEGNRKFLSMDSGNEAVGEVE